jgi:Gram-negative bacterial TonB protein C-terminal
MRRLTPLALIVATLSACLCAGHQSFAAEGLKLPPQIKGFLYYPEKAKRLNQQGRVLLEFHISKRGKITDWKIAAEEPQGFVGDKKAFETELHEFLFDLPPGWLDAGGAQQLYQLSVVFLLSPCTDVNRCQAVPQYPVINTMTLTGSALAMSPPK